MEFLISLLGLVIILPFLSLITILYFISHRGNPFFIQSRSGKNEKVFKVIKSKPMNDKRVRQGKLLPDSIRLTPIGIYFEDIIG